MHHHSMQNVASDHGDLQRVFVIVVKRVAHGQTFDGAPRRRAYPLRPIVAGGTKNLAKIPGEEIAELVCRDRRYRFHWRSPNDRGSFSKSIAALKRTLPLFESGFDATSAYPGKGPIRGAPGTVWNIFAPGIGPHRVNRPPNDVKSPECIDLANHDRLGKVVIGVHDFLEAAWGLYPLPIHRLANR